MIKIYTEQQTSKLLFPSLPCEKALCKLKRTRQSRKINYRKDGHYICFTESDIKDYIRGIKKCKKNTQSESTGSQKEPTEVRGKLDHTINRQDVTTIRLLAQKTFGKPKRS